jgi:hypothetical protein
MTRIVGNSHRVFARSLPLAQSALIAASLLLTAGCETRDPSRAHGVSAEQFKDVVVPAGLKLREGGHESYSRDDAGWRQAHFVYSGQTPVEDAISYVRQRMPQHSWSLAGESALETGGTKLRFERDIYSTEYTFSRTDGATLMVVDYSTDYSRR